MGKLIPRYSFNSWYNHPLTTFNIYSKARLIHIPCINILNLMFSLRTFESLKESADIFNIHGLLSLRFNWFLFNHGILRMGFKPASRPTFANCGRIVTVGSCEDLVSSLYRPIFIDYRRVITVMGGCENLVGSLCKSLISKRHPNAMETFNIPI